MYMPESNKRALGMKTRVFTHFVSFLRMLSSLIKSQGLSRTKINFKYFQGLEIRPLKFKGFQDVYELCVHGFLNFQSKACGVKNLKTTFWTKGTTIFRTSQVFKESTWVQQSTWNTLITNLATFWSRRTRSLPIGTQSANCKAKVLYYWNFLTETIP